MPPALGPRAGKTECTFGSCGNEGKDRETDVRPEAERGEPKADKKALGRGTQAGETRWAGRSHQRGGPLAAGGSAVRHLVGKVVL